MKTYLGILILTFLLTLKSFAAQSFSVPLKVTGGYLTSNNRVDGSFEGNVNSQWVASVGTIVKTASTQFQGSYKGVWAGTGTGTLDLQWTATASNTYDLNAMVKSADSDLQVCAYVNGAETGCKAFTATNVSKVSVIASSWLGSSFYLRLKHTGSDAFSAEVDDGKIEPWTQQIANLTTQEAISYTGYTSKDGSNRVLFKTKETLKSNESSILSVTNSGYTKYTAMQNCNGTIAVGLSFASYATRNLVISHYNSSGTLLAQPDLEIQNNMASMSTAYTFKASVGDYFYISSATTPSDDVISFFSITASAISENIIQSWQDGTDWKALTYTEVNALSGNQGLGSFTAGGVEWMRGKDGLLHYKGKLTVGASSASEARIPYPAGLIAAGTDKIPSLQIAHGSMSFNRSSTTWFGLVPLIEPNVNYFTMSLITSLDGGLSKTNGSYFTISGTQISFNFTVPIAGWSSQPTLLALPVSKENVFSARFTTSAPSISWKNNDWITSITKNGTGDLTINYSKLNLTAPPVIVLGGTSQQVRHDAPTSTSVRVYTTASGGEVQDNEFDLLLQKQEPDYTPQGVIPVNITPDTFVQTSGAMNPVHFSVSYGSTINTACSAANTACAYLDQIGNYVSNITRGATVGFYTLNTVKTYSKIKCSSGQGITSAGGFFVVKNNLSCNSCSSIPFVTVDYLTNTIDSYGTLMCDAIP